MFVKRDKKERFASFTCLLIMASVVILILMNMSIFKKIDLDGIIGSELNRYMPISDFLPEEVSIVCEFWPYIKLEDFRDADIYSEIEGSDVFPINEDELVLVYLNENRELFGQDRIKRFSRRLHWSLSNLTVNKNCYYTPGIEIFLSSTAEVLTVNVLRNDDAVYP